jgi:hypothetical protein
MDPYFNPIMHCIVGNEEFYVDKVTGKELDITDIHPSYLDGVVYNYSPVDYVIQIDRVDEEFLVVVPVLLEIKQISVKYTQLSKSFEVHMFDPRIIINAILSDDDFRLYFMSRDHPYHKTNKHINYLEPLNQVLKLGYTLVDNDDNIRKSEEKIRLLIKEEVDRVDNPRENDLYETIYHNPKHMHEPDSDGHSDCDSCGTDADALAKEQELHDLDPKKLISTEDIDDLERIFGPKIDSPKLDEFSGDITERRSTKKLKKIRYEDVSVYSDEDNDLLAFKNVKTRSVQDISAMNNDQIRHELFKSRTAVVQEQSKREERIIYTKDKIIRIDTDGNIHITKNPDYIDMTDFNNISNRPFSIYDSIDDSESLPIPPKLEEREDNV